MIWLMGAVAFLGGILNTVQSGSNATLSKSLDQPIAAALIVSMVTASMFLIIALVTGIKIPKEAMLVAVPWWAWIGGLMGGFYVLASILLAEKLGAAVFIGCTVTAGLITSVAMDHFGLVGFKEHAAGFGRLAGVALMLGGLALINVF